MPQIKFGSKCPESILSCQHSQNIKRPKKNQVDTQKNGLNNKRQNLFRKTAAEKHNYFDHLNMLGIFEGD